MSAARYVVSGQVQGVGFRWFVARHARALGLAGFARNLANGDVEVVAAGADDSTLARLEALLRDGPANAMVTRVKREDHPEAGVPRGRFDVL